MSKNFISWVCEDGHHCTVSITASRSNRALRCDALVGYHAYTHETRYSIPQYDGRPMFCGARLLEPERAYA